MSLYQLVEVAFYGKSASYTVQYLYASNSNKTQTQIHFFLLWKMNNTYNQIYSYKYIRIMEKVFFIIKKDLLILLYMLNWPNNKQLA